MGSEVLESKLQSLTIAERTDVTSSIALNSLREAFTGIISRMPAELLAGSESDREVKMWEAFAEVVDREVEFQETRESRAVPVEKKRQILADVLVWAEVTETDYDPSKAQFVVGPHQTDESFQRIGTYFKEAKSSRGLR